ncbi:MAG: hypothetical protein FJY29_05745 [Betaproteobacteria bacterium]|nr:hypothetical protein [Betaproteobacteria bacterium]
MKALSYIKWVVLAISLWAVAPAYGYQPTHDYYNRFRSPYRNNVYLSQQVNMARSDVNTGEGAAQRFDGYGLQLSAGLEHFRFIQTGAFFSTSQLNNNDNAANEMRMIDSGIETKMVMSTPVSNIIVGAAGVISRANLNIDGERLAASGTGIRGSFEVSYFASSQVSLVVGASHTMSKYSGKNGKGVEVKPESRTTRLGAGLTVWL